MTFLKSYQIIEKSIVNTLEIFQGGVAMKVLWIGDKFIGKILNAQHQELIRLYGSDLEIIVTPNINNESGLDKIAAVINDGGYEMAIACIGEREKTDFLARKTKVDLLVPVFIIVKDESSADVCLETPCGVQYLDFLKFMRYHHEKDSGISFWDAFPIIAAT